MALIEEHTVARAVVVCLEKYPRRLGSGLEVLPWQFFRKVMVRWHRRLKI